mgnify:CR=1 FL=1
MSKNYEVISRFLDDDLFDPNDLSEALSDAEGRAFLVDLIALRKIVQPATPMPAVGTTARGRAAGWRTAAAAAALVAGLAGGYWAGVSRSSALSADAPPASRVVEAVPFVPGGGHR